MNGVITPPLPIHPSIIHIVCPGSGVFDCLIEGDY